MVSVEQWQRMTPKQQWDAYVAAAQVADAANKAPKKAPKHDKPVEEAPADAST